MRGKFLSNDGDKFYVRGVTYGTFRPQADGSEFPDPQTIAEDFAAMAAAGINTVRTYTVPPRSLLDAAGHAGLYVMVGLAAERYVGYLNDRNGGPDVDEIIRSGVRTCSGHPAVLGYCIGNEIPAGTVRWHGRRRVERYLAGLSRVVREEDPESFVTYANYPSTEYLELDFLDVLCFNVFLESPDQLEAYVKRLHNIAGDRPLLIGELGLDSRRNGEEAQARSLGSQVRTAFAAGCAGVFVYAWTDEWHTAAGEVLDWDFGLTRRDRSPKTSLTTVSAAFADVPFRADGTRPRVSVVVCSYQGGQRIDRCLDGISKLNYPNFETIVVDDGSTDGTGARAGRHAQVRVISTEHRGLGHARNIGMKEATGEFVAYIDDDAHPDAHWLDYLVHTFASGEYAAVGGPNIPPPDTGLVGRCVARSPGNPTHVLLSDEEAEHVPGCNMAFRRSHLQAIGGFDPRFRAAGDDVDLCWRIRERGWRIGFSPSAMVWHEPRPTVRTYLRQQVGYGQAEGLLEQKWPERYNAVGQASWQGRLYGVSVRSLLRGRGRIYQGVWGQAPFQSVYQSSSQLGLLPLTPEWYLAILELAAVSGLAALWAPLLFAVAAVVVGLGATVVQAAAAASRAPLDLSPRERRQRLAARGAVALLHLLQPLARLRGRMRSGLTPWRRVGASGLTLPLPYRTWFWSEAWRAPGAWVRSVEEALREAGSTVVRGGEFDRFDLEIRGGTSGSVRLLMAVEEHGAGRQLVRVRIWPHWFRPGRWLSAAGVALAVAAALDSAWEAAVLLAAAALLVALRAVLEAGGAAADARRGLDQRLAEAPTTTASAWAVRLGR